MLHFHGGDDDDDDDDDIWLVQTKTLRLRFSSIWDALSLFLVNQSFCVLVISILTFSMILLLSFYTVPNKWYILFFLY
jgi:hypothetical protein